MLMMGVQVDGLRKHPNGRVDQLEDRYLGMVEAPSSNLGTSTIRTDFINSMVECASTKLIPNTFVDCSARPPEMIQGSSVGRLATKEILTNASFVGSARPSQ